MKNKFAVFAPVLALAALPFLGAVAGPPQIQSVRDAQSAFIKEATILASAARTASGNSSSPIDVAAYAGGVIAIDVTAVSGTSPSMTVNVVTCSDSGTSNCGFVHTASSAITATGKTLLKVNNFGRFVRIEYTISGTSPSFTFSVYGAFKPTT